MVITKNIITEYKTTLKTHEIYHKFLDAENKHPENYPMEQFINDIFSEDVTDTLLDRVYGIYLINKNTRITKF